MNDELSNKIINRIDKEDLRPLPRWRFVLLRIIFWLLAILSVVVGSLAIGAMLFLLFDFRAHGLSLPADVMEALLFTPYLWFVIFALFLFIAQISIKHTEKGYQYHFYIVVIASICLSFVFGSILNSMGVGRMAHEFLSNTPIYNLVTHDADDILQLRRARVKGN